MSDAPEFFYSYKPKMMGPSLDVQLSKDALDWQLGGRTGRIAYPMIHHIRLGYKPTNMAGSRFIAEIWPINETKLSLASVSSRSMLDMAPQNNEYVGFLRELHRRVAASNSNCVFEAGIPAWRWWPSVIVALLTVAAVAYVIIQGLWSGQYLVAGGIAVIGAWFLWQIWNIVVRNRPRFYHPDAIPADVLPS